MDLLFTYKQEKKEKGSNQVKCDLKLFHTGDLIMYQSTYWLNYKIYGEFKEIEFYHQLEINTKNGDITTTYKILNDFVNLYNVRNITTIKKNDFGQVLNLTSNGFTLGQKKRGYWGVNYDRAIDKIFMMIFDILQPKLKSTYLKDKTYRFKYVSDPLYDLLVDFHLDSKGIKSHNSIYTHILNDYPKQKWLKENDNKFLPAILDQYGIKCKFLIKELNDTSKMIHIRSLNYICKLFGENYIDYLKQIDWKGVCVEFIENKRIHTLKTEKEKKCMVNLINKWETTTLSKDAFLHSINKLLSTREFLESAGHDLKFRVKNDLDFENISEMWGGLKRHINKGYKLRYGIDPEFVSFVEQDIIHENEVYRPKVILSEQDFRVEGYTMKNCMINQFDQGAIFIYVSLRNKRRRINTQYRKGKLIQSLGKTNTPVPKDFKTPIEVLSARMATRPDIQWKREKFDFIK